MAVIISYKPSNIKEAQQDPEWTEVLIKVHPRG